jgi:hypothetical protein
LLVTFKAMLDIHGTTVLVHSSDSAHFCVMNGAGAVLDINLGDRARSVRIVVAEYVIALVGGLDCRRAVVAVWQRGL